jgi:ankyrin repeat protein
MPLPAIADIEAHKQFAWFVTGLLESPGAPGPLVVLTRLGLTGVRFCVTFSRPLCFAKYLNLHRFGVHPTLRRAQAWPLDSVYSASSASVWHIAANSGSPTVVAAVATGGRDGINCEDDEAHCPLELACYGNGGDEGTAAAMVEAGANPDRPCTLNKIHPLELALIHRNWFDFARAALNAGACIEADVVRTLIGRQNFQALDIVIASKGHVRQPDGVVEQWTLDTVAAKWAVGLALLLLNGSNPNATDDDTGRTLLHSAALHGSTECCRVLVAVGASLTRVAPTRLSTPTLGTPLLFAINASEWDTAALLSTCPAANAALNDGLAALEFVPPSRRSIWHSALANLPAERPLLTRAHLEEIVAGARALPSTHTPQRSAREEARTLLEAHASLPTPHQQRPQPESVRGGAARPAIASPQPRPATAEAVPAVSRHARAGADELIEPAQNSDHPVYAVASHSRRRTTSSVPRVLPQLPRSKSTARHAPRRASAPLPNPRASRCNYPSSSGHGTCMSRVIDSPGQHCDRHTCTSAGCTSGKPSKNELCARCGTNAALAAADADSERDATCVICMEHPKTALLQHGGDGHLCCCMSCAKLLTARGDPCPLCRKPIDAVIQVYS